jgi:hypothetical protein
MDCGQWVTLLPEYEDDHHVLKRTQSYREIARRTLNPLEQNDDDQRIPTGNSRLDPTLKNAPEFPNGARFNSVLKCNNLELSVPQADNLGRWYSMGGKTIRKSIGFSECMRAGPRPKIDSADTECFNLYRQSFSKNSGFPKPEGDLAPMSEMVFELVEFEFPKTGLGFTGVPKKESIFLPDTNGNLQIPLISSKDPIKNRSNLRKVSQLNLIALKRSVLQMSQFSFRRDSGMLLESRETYPL